MNYGYSQPLERLRLKMTNEERGYFSSLLEIADKDLTGKLEGKTAANFLKRSGLPKEILKKIWLIAAQTNPSFLEKDEFYIALRLVALAQSNMEYSEESIRLNHPLPPLPKFDLKNTQQQSVSDMSSVMSMNSAMKQMPPLSNESIPSSIPVPMILNTEPSLSHPIIPNQNEISKANPQRPQGGIGGSPESFIIFPNEEDRYNQIFEIHKEKDGFISPFKATQLWFQSNVSNEVIHKIMSLIPFKNNDSMTNKEFNVCTYLVFKSFQAEIPKVLPMALKEYLGIFDNSDNSFGNSNNNSIDNKPMMTSFNQNPIIPLTTNASIDMESALLKEFKIKPSETSGTTETKQSAKSFQGINSVGVIPGVKNLLEQLKMMEKDAINENEALTQECEDSQALLNSFNDDIEKLNKTVNDLNRKNQTIKDEITDYRRRINIEKDNMAKLSVNMKILKDEVGGTY